MSDAIWLFGRGASIACGLPWAVPFTVDALPPRDARVAAIREGMRAAMHGPGVDTAPYVTLLALLETRTSPAWRHLFMTTNWDTLLDDEVEAKCPAVVPPWLKSTFVFHLNGRALDTMPDPERRSDILLETDSESDRAKSQEYEQAKCARWLVVDSDPCGLRRVSDRIQSRFPGADVRAVARDFASWVESGLSELRAVGILNPA